MQQKNICYSLQNLVKGEVTVNLSNERVKVLHDVKCSWFQLFLIIKYFLDFFNSFKVWQQTKA